MKSASTKNATHMICLIHKRVLHNNHRLSEGLQQRLEHFISHNGVEWTVNRLKVYYNAALHILNGDRLSAKRLFQEQNISCSKKGYPTDAYGDLFRKLEHSDKPNNVKTCLGLLRVYTAFKLPRPTPNQVKKAKKTISEPIGLTDEQLDVTGNGHTSLDVVGMSLSYNILNNIPELNGVLKDFHNERVFVDKANNLTYTLDGLSPFTATNCLLPKEYKLPKEYMDLPYAKQVVSLCTSAGVPDCLLKYLPSREIYDASNLNLYRQGFSGNIVGRIHIIQERGAKARVVGIPNTWIQLLYKPLHDILAKLNRRFPESCVENQSRGALTVKRHIADGKSAYSVDLSAATDRFPIELQSLVLRHLGYVDHADGLEKIARSRWVFPYDENDPNIQLGHGVKNYISYNTGQPMGMYGSFPLFHLTHLVFARYVVDLVNKFDARDHEAFHDGTYFVLLGDDIVWSNEAMANTYRAQLASINVNVSVHKSFSGTLSEFAGYIMYRHSNGSYAWRPYKFPDGDIVTTAVSFMHNFNKPLFPKSRRWERIFEAYSNTRLYRNLDLSPTFSDDYDRIRGATPHIDLGRVAGLGKMLNRLCADFFQIPVPEVKVTIPIVNETNRFNFIPIERMVKEDIAKLRRISPFISQDPLIKRYLEEVNNRISEEHKEFYSQFPDI